MLPPQHAVTSNRLNASRPPLILAVNAAFTYAGGQRFILYGLADAEQHLFVAPGAAPGVAGRLLWVQFEHFLEDNTRTYNYPATEAVTLGGYEFLVDEGRHDWQAGAAERPASDSARVLAWLTEHGWRLPAEAMFVRLVCLLDASRRRELMLIYGEAVPPGLRLADLEPAGPAAAQWPALAADLRTRALSAFTIEPASSPQP